MSHISKFNTQITDVTALLQALADLGYGNVETCAIPQPLYGYQGDKRQQTADIIIRRKQIGKLSNDIGFKRNATGSYDALISDWDRKKHTNAWLQQLTQRYAYHATVNSLQSQGFDVITDEIDTTGKIHLRLRRMA